MSDHLLEDSNLKWHWKMDWCLSKYINPANSHAWELAERRYQELYRETQELKSRRLENER